MSLNYSPSWTHYTEQCVAGFPIRWLETNPESPDSFNIVSFHGFTGLASDYAIPEAYFPHRHNWFSIECPGHGKTPALNPDAVNIRKKWINAIAKLISQHIKGPFILMGYSMGARIVLDLQEYLSPLANVLIGATAGIKDPDLKKKRFRADDQLRVDIEKMSLNSFLDFWQKQPLIRTQRHIPYAIRQWLRKNRQAHSLSELAKSLQTLGQGSSPSHWKNLPFIQTPSLLISGEKDSKYRAIANNMCKYLHHCQNEVIHNAGHACHLENGQRFAEIVTNFIKTL